MVQQFVFPPTCFGFGEALFFIAAIDQLDCLDIKFYRYRIGLIPGDFFCFLKSPLSIRAPAAEKYRNNCDQKNSQMVFHVLLQRTNLLASYTQ